MRRKSIQIKNIEVIAKQLTSIDFPIVFTGGAVVGLLITDNVVADVRPTDDVDLIIGITKYSDFGALQQKLTTIGFRHDQSGPICRFTYNGITVDLMPTNVSILGFTNQWYEHALRTALPNELPDGTVIKLITAPYFVATKLEAFFDRGSRDFMGSHDIEDILAVIDGRPELLAEIEKVDKSLKNFLAECFNDFLIEDEFIDSISGHLPPDQASQDREDILIERMKGIIAIANGLQ